VTLQSKWGVQHVKLRRFSSFSDDSDGEIEYHDFGDYSIVLPPEPGQAVQRVPIRLVPSTIKRPPYVMV
jgi:hypothetical protein